MDAPLVSIVTPVHNTAPYLAECIESVLRQRYAHWELVVVDNASTDGSGDIVRRYATRDPRVRLVRHEQLVPQVPNYNRCIGEVSPRARYVHLLEADNWLFEDCLDKMVALAEAHPRVGIVSAYNATETRLRLTGLPLARRVVDGRELARMHLAGDAYLFGAPSTVLMRADVVRARRPFYDESYLLAEDLSACYEALRNWDFGFVHQVLTFLRTENESILSRIRGFDAQTLDRVVLLQRHGRDFLSADEFDAAERRLSARHYAALAQGALRRAPEAFWRFHREGLESAGLKLHRGRLAQAIGRELVSRAAHPLQTVRRLLGR